MAQQDNASCCASKQKCCFISAQLFHASGKKASTQVPSTILASLSNIQYPCRVVSSQNASNPLARHRRCSLRRIRLTHAAPAQRQSVSGLVVWPCRTIEITVALRTDSVMWGTTCLPPLRNTLCMFYPQSERLPRRRFSDCSQGLRRGLCKGHVRQPPRGTVHVGGVYVRVMLGSHLVGRVRRCGPGLSCHGPIHSLQPVL